MVFNLLILQVMAADQEVLFDKLDTLTDQNWQGKMEEADIWLVVFYVAWCPHAQAFEPKLEAAAEDLMQAGYKIKFGAVDLSRNPGIGYKYRI